MNEFAPQPDFLAVGEVLSISAVSNSHFAFAFDAFSLDGHRFEPGNERQGCRGIGEKDGKPTICLGFLPVSGVAAGNNYLLKLNSSHSLI
jgi:hypothetical protein